VTSPTNKRKRGRPPTGKPPAKRIGFYVSEADHAWLTALENRSAWITEQIKQVRSEEQKGTDRGTDERG
jgi:hypothetical protein